MKLKESHNLIESIITVITSFLLLVILLQCANAAEISPYEAKARQYELSATFNRLQAEKLKMDVLNNPRLYLSWRSHQIGLSVEEVQTLDYIMWKESRYCTDIDNPVSTASGCFQIIRSTWNANSEWPWSDRYDHVKNIDTALRIYQSRGTQPWGI